ncbi:hypothetical protein AWZ03_012007 [Drosophila navojoa]|uniref:non-specific serine/threonine protein kinase n=1 Tax=Drosophila navojoa TaxID=7232 RepID=A0A484AY98_DRONA|nr:hypothetical protein AWZ03_012007 [Drosophila navojoa]
MKSAVYPLGNCNNANENASILSDGSGHKGNKRSGNKYIGNNNITNSNNNINNYNNSNINNVNENTLWPPAYDMQASSANANPVLRNINNDMTKDISRKVLQCKMQFTSNDRLDKMSGDDMRMSKIMRRLHNESSPAAALELCNKLDMAVRTPVNVGYLTRSFDVILDGMQSLFKQCPAPVLNECSKTLGVIGYINRMSYPIYEDFIVRNFKMHKRMQKYLILALQTTLSCDTKCDMHIFSDKIMALLKDFLEGADSPDIFMGISMCIVQFSLNYREVFECHFTDVVDIIIGWQLEVGQPEEVRTHCAYVLEQLTPYFSKQLDFSYGLLTQFIEDISEKSERPGERIGAFVGAFNTLLKCLTRMRITCESIVSLALVHLIKVLPAMLENPEGVGDDALININELFCICLLNGYANPDAGTLDKLIHMQFEHITKLPDSQKLSCLYLLLCTVRKLRARLPASLVQLIFQSDPADAAKQTYLTSIRLQNDTKAYKLLLRTCQETLLIKNVPILQQAYKQLVQDVDKCISKLAQAQAQADSSEADILLIFHLAALAALAKQTSSIIGMYACKPSILELLITNCRAGELSIWSKHPTTHHAILCLLVVHCQANHNFRNNSSLLRESDAGKNLHSSSSQSPTAHSFGQILKFLAHCLVNGAQLAPVNLKHLLGWTKSLLVECGSRCAVLLEHDDFMTICESVASTAAKYAPMESALCIQAVLGYGTSNLSLELLLLYRETALQQLQPLASSAHEAYAQIYAQLPLSLIIARRVPSGIGSNHICVWQQRLSQCSAIRENVFRDFFERLQTPEQQPFGECLRSMFMRSCQVTQLDERQEKLSQCMRRCQRLATVWLQFEAARFCVDQKLRTPLGKPQDTFLAFEAIVTRYARLLSGCGKDNERRAFDDLSLQQLSNTRANLNLLLGFLDALEKLIYNAAEGSAFALRAPEKPVSAFFRLNNPTCQSWFNRIRTSVIIIAMHCHQPELVIRYAQQILLTHKTQDSMYSQAIVYLAWAFVTCRESDSLRGLYVWARARSSKCYRWLQSAADQAAERTELAVVGYRSILADGDLETHVRQFVQAQLFECLHCTGQWTQIVELKAQWKRAGDNIQVNPFLHKSMTHLSVLEQLLAKSEATSDELNAALHTLSIWPSDNEPHASFSADCVLEKLENIVLQQCHSADDLKPFEVGPSVQQLLDMNWRECLLNYSCEQQHWQQLTLLKHITQTLSSSQEPLMLLPLDSKGREERQQQQLQQQHHHHQHHIGSLGSSLFLRCVAWTQLLRNHCNVNSLGSLYLETAAVAREEGNQSTCQAMLELFFGQPLKDVAGYLLTNSPDTNNLQLLRGYTEVAKCLYLQQQQQQQQQCSELSAINVCTSLCLAIQKQLPQPELASDVGAELLLTLADWIAARSCNGLATNMSTQMQQLLEQLPECPLARSSTQPTTLPHGERLVARLINASLQQRPNNEEALIAYGNWCYRWGKKTVDSGTVLSQADITAIGEALGGDQPLDGDTLQELLEALRTEPQPGNNCEQDELQTDAQCELRLRQLSALADKPASVLESIVRIWRRAMANTFDYYKAAAGCYFHYLSLKAGSGEGCALPPQQPRFHVDDSNMVTTTLRLLRLIVKHASGLQDVLEQGLKTTPIGPWKVIIPQLFSRLNHHEPYVRKSVCALLCRLAESRPQLVTFPAVVGANRELQATPIGSGSNSSSSSPAQSYAILLNALTKQSPEVVQHVQLLVKELRRVCLLWDEYWIHSLAQIYNSYVGRVNGLASEFKPDDHEGKQNRFDSWRPQLLSDMEALMAFTTREAETNYERSFKRRFDAPIASTLEALRNRPYPEAWDKLKQLYHVLQSNMLRGTSSTLKMQTISPVLCEIGRMRISMPGLDAQDEQQPVHIESVESTVCILPTKTKPKKVAFYGSNGQKYTFLFKGLEDLHLDERIMQFLSISNAIMATKNDTPHSCYRAHHYSVIPLGPQSGLISWVDGVTPLFALYKKWQQRQPQPATGATSRRLTDLYYNKLSPLLAKHNMLVTDPRRQWPLSVLRQVLNELQQETPADLLTRELWCHAGSAAEWRQSVRRYTNCMAVMSVIGYVIGLGDRHLDNVLINLSSGDIVHIDYNVCFEKGRTLRIPERVPFRLTQNMVHALGITGIEVSS